MCDRWIFIVVNFVINSSCDSLDYGERVTFCDIPRVLLVIDLIVLYLPPAPSHAHALLIVVSIFVLLFHGLQNIIISGGDRGPDGMASRMMRPLGVRIGGGGMLRLRMLVFELSLLEAGLWF